MTLPKTSASNLLILALATLVAACSGDDSATGDTTPSSSSSTTDASASASSTSDESATATATATATASGTGTDSGTDSGTSTGDPTTDATTENPTTDGSTSTGDPTTTDATTDPTEATTDDPTGGIDDDGCEAGCEAVIMCIPDYPLDECLAECKGEFEDLEGAECKTATAKANMCIGGLECEQILGDDFGECNPLINKADELCGDGVGPCEADLQTMGKGCRVSFVCEDSLSGMQCNQQNCVCVEDGMEVGQCKNEGFCALDLDAAIDAANACCGWEF